MDSDFLGPDKVERPGREAPDQEQDAGHGTRPGLEHARRDIRKVQARGSRLGVAMRPTSVPESNGGRETERASRANLTKRRQHGCRDAPFSSVTGPASML